jgi:plasmid stabilization system protein ParE
MKRRYLLAPQAARDLVGIWRHISKEAGRDLANRVESVIRSKIVLLAETPGMGHKREDLTAASVLFFPVYSYLIVYRPGTAPLEVASILHGSRDVQSLLAERESTMDFPH